MARQPSQRRHATDEAGDINLTPIMSILVILIPMIIYAFTFFEVKITRVALPKMGQPKQVAKEDEKKPLLLTVLVSKKGFAIKMQEEMAAEPEPPIPKRPFTVKLLGKERKVVDYDYPALYTRLMRIKKEHKDERRIYIHADPLIPWQVVARVLDTTRYQLEEPAYDDLDKWAHAPLKRDSNGNPVPLFDDPKFTVAEGGS